MSAGMVFLSESQVSVMFHQFYAQCVSTGMVLLSEYLSPCLTVTMTPFMYAVNVPWRGVAASQIISQSLPSLSFMHTAMSAEWGCQAGLPKHRHLSSTMFHTHTHTKCTMRNGAAIKGHQSLPRLNSPFLYTLPATATSHQLFVPMIHSCKQ